MKYLKINNNLFVENRIKFKNRLKKNTLNIFNSNDVMLTNGDGTMLFYQNSDLSVSGIDQEESLLVIFPDNDIEKYFSLRKQTNISLIWEDEN